MQEQQAKELTELQNSQLMKAVCYIEKNIQRPLTVEIIAEHSPWSRWQLQRIFVAATGLTLAQYVRELRLSKAANDLLVSKRRQIDIALSCGFESEIHFSRCFKQYFSCTPGQYRKRNIKTLIRLPLSQTSLIPIRIEHKSPFILVGDHSAVKGFAAAQPDFHQVIPQHWQNTLEKNPQWVTEEQTLFGAFINSSNAQGHFDYWAGIEDTSNLALKNGINLPGQSYAVISHRNAISHFSLTVSWFIDRWLPQSQLIYQPGADLESYPQSSLSIKQLTAEYWIPINNYPL